MAYIGKGRGPRTRGGFSRGRISYNVSTRFARRDSNMLSCLDDMAQDGDHDEAINFSDTDSDDIVRNINGKPDIDEKINLGRKTAYSLMGAGFHGGGGLKPSQNGYIWSTFVVPRLLYGLETLLLTKKDIDCLERFQRRCLRQIQGLPDKASNTICLALLGGFALGSSIA